MSCLPVNWAQRPTRAARIRSADLAMMWWDTECLPHWGVCVMPSSFFPPQPGRKNEECRRMTVSAHWLLKYTVPVKGVEREKSFQEGKVFERKKKRKTTSRVKRKMIIPATFSHSHSFILSHISLLSVHLDNNQPNYRTCHLHPLSLHLLINVYLCHLQFFL